MVDSGHNIRAVTLLTADEYLAAAGPWSECLSSSA